MPNIHAIRALRARGISKREIARTLRMSRKTVDKYAAEGYVVSQEPRMLMRRKRLAPKLDPWKATLEEWMAQDAKAPRKQRRTARKLYQDLLAHYPGEVHASEVTVRRFVGNHRNANREAFVPLEFAPGAMAEADFGHTMVILAGERDPALLHQRADGFRQTVCQGLSTREDGGLARRNSRVLQCFWRCAASGGRARTTQSASGAER